MIRKYSTTSLKTDRGRFRDNQNYTYNKMPPKPKQKKDETDDAYAIRYRQHRDKANEINRRARQRKQEEFVLVEPKQEVEIPVLPPPVPEPVVEETREQKLIRQHEANKAKQREIYYRKQQERIAYSRQHYLENRDEIVEKYHQTKQIKEKQPEKPYEEMSPAERIYASMKKASKKMYDKKVEEKKANGTYRPRGRPRKQFPSENTLPLLPASPEVKPILNTIDLLPFTI